MKKDKIGKSISIKRAGKIAVKSLLQAEQRRQNWREREAGQVSPAVGWTRQEAGWYMNPELGGICKAVAGWWFHPGAGSGLSMMRYFGPYETLLAAQRAAAELAKGRAK